MAISNDNEFKAALSALSPDRQRRAAARFVENVLPCARIPASKAQ